MAIQPIEDFPEYTGPQRFLDAVERAARYAGEAASMATRHSIAGNDHLSGVWEAEQTVWETRMGANREASPFDRVNLQILGDQAFNEARGAVPVYAPQRGRPQ